MNNLKYAKQDSFKYLKVDAGLVHNPNLNWNEKALLAEIYALQGEDGCFASNAHFGRRLGLTNRRVQQIIQRLEEDGMLLRLNKGTDRRRLFACEAAFGELPEDEVHEDAFTGPKIDDKPPPKESAELPSIPASSEAAAPAMHWALPDESWREPWQAWLAVHQTPPTEPALHQALNRLKEWHDNGYDIPHYLMHYATYRMVKLRHPANGKRRECDYNGWMEEQVTGDNALLPQGADRLEW